MLPRPVLAWLAILALAILNGALREAVLVPNLGKTAGYVTSGVLLAALVLLVAISLAPWMRLASARRAMGVGALWLVMTVVFEFGFGIARGKPWTDIVAAYRFADGNIWPLVLVVVLFAPLAGWRLRARP
jgi:hypothetical protein